MVPNPNIKNNQSVVEIPNEIKNETKNLDRSHNQSEFRSIETSSTTNFERYLNFIYASIIIIAIIMITQRKKILK